MTAPPQIVVTANAKAPDDRVADHIDIPPLNDNVLLEILGHVGIRDLANVAKCSVNLQALAIRTFCIRFNGCISLDQNTTESEPVYRQILQEFGGYADRVEIVNGERRHHHLTMFRSIRLFQCVWLYVSPDTVRSLKVHPFNLEADRVNYLGAESVAVLPRLHELDLLIPLVSANLNCRLPFGEWCPLLRVLRLAGHFGMDIPADKMPTALHTVDIRNNFLMAEEHVQLLLRINRHTLEHLTLTGLNEICDVNRFLDFLISIGVHRTLSTLVLQLHRSSKPTGLLHTAYTIDSNMTRFQALKVLDIAGFGNLAIPANAHLFGALARLEKLIISSPLVKLPAQVHGDFLMAFARNVPPQLKEIWLKRMIVERSVWEAFVRLMPATCKCYLIAVA